MKKEYLDRSRIVSENWKMKKCELMYSIIKQDRLLTKQLLEVLFLNINFIKKALEKAEPNGNCYNKIVKTLISLTTNWEELNSLKKDTF